MANKNKSIKKKHDIIRFFGILENINWNEKEKNMKKLGSPLNKKLR